MAATESTPLKSSTSADHDEDHHGGDHHHGSSRRLHEAVPAYAAPKQRQRWDDVQMLPHVNWGDLYFDLFYVAAAYQLSHAFKDSPTLEGLLYFIATYLPVWLIWNEKLVYDARFAPDDNLFHRAIEILHLCILGLIVACIQPSEAMRDPANNPIMMWFTGGYVGIMLVSCGLHYDLIRNAVGGPEARNGARLQLYRKIIALAVYGFGFAIATLDYFTEENLLGSEEEEEEEYVNYWPAYLMIVGYLFEFLIFPLALSLILIPSWGISHKEVFVPINIEYTIHRIGEWVMLMLGESVLSILTIPQREFLSPNEDSFHYSVNFFCGILTVTMFQYLFFRTQPAEAKDHAMRRSEMGGRAYVNGHTVYSASLILVGCSYKMMLSREEMLKQAEEEHVDYDIEARIALVYAISQAVSFLSLDFVTFTHRGFGVNVGRFCPQDRNGNSRCATIPLIVLSINLLLTFLTLNLSMIHDMTLLSLYGCGLVFCQVLLRTFGLRYFPVTVAQMEQALHSDYASFSEDDARAWPNVTMPVSTSAKIETE